LSAEVEQGIGGGRRSKASEVVVGEEVVVNFRESVEKWKRRMEECGEVEEEKGRRWRSGREKEGRRWRRGR
jgi:hypothetical protein